MRVCVRLSHLVERESIEIKLLMQRRCVHSLCVVGSGVCTHGLIRRQQDEMQQVSHNSLITGTSVAQSGRNPAAGRQLLQPLPSGRC